MKLKTLTLLAALLFLAGSSAAQTDGLDFRTQDPIDFYSDLNLQGNNIGSVSGLSGVNYQRFDNQDGDFIRVLGSGGASHTLRYDDRALHFYSGSSGSVLNLTRSGNVQTFGNLNLQSNDIVAPNLVTTDGTGSDVIIVRDTSQRQDLARFYEGGNVSLPSGNLSLGNNRITDLASPQTGEDAVRLNYLASNYVNKSGDTLYGTLNMNSNTISNIAQLTNYYSNPCQSEYVMVDVTDSGVISCQNASSMVSENFVYESGDTMSGNLDMTGNDIVDTGLVDGVNIESPGNAITIDGSNGYAVISNSIDSSELASNSVTNDQLANSDVFTVGGLDSNGDIDMSENQIQNVNSLQDNTGTDTLRFDGSNNVVVPSGNLNMDGNSITNYFSNPCQSGYSVVDVTDSGVISCQNASNMVSESFVYSSGDSMTGALDMTGNDILDTGLVDGVNIESPGNAITVDGSNGYAVPSNAIDTGEIASGSVTNTQLANSDSFTVGGLTSNGNVDVSQNPIQNVNSLQDNTGTDTLRFDGSNNVVVPSGNLNMDGNSITSFFSNPCSSGNMMVDVTDSGTLSCTDVTNEVSGDFVSKSGDSMSGELDMTGNNIVDIGNLGGANIVNSNNIAGNAVTPTELDESATYSLGWGNLGVSQSDISVSNLGPADADLDMNGNSINGFFSNPCSSGNMMVDVTDSGTLSCTDVTNEVSNDFVTRTGDTMSGNLRNTGGNIIAGDGNSLQVRPSDGSAWYDIYDDSGTFTIRQTGDQDALRIRQNSHDVVVPNGNLDMSGNSITDYYGSPCSSQQAVADIQNNGVLNCVDVTNTVSDDFVSRSGDSMNGDLDMTDGDINQVSDINTGGTQLNVGGDMTVSGTVTATGGLQTDSGSVTSDRTMCLGDQCA